MCDHEAGGQVRCHRNADFASGLSLTHSGVARELREKIGLSDALIRISIGIENVEDLISDLA
jgi:cystathionine beta-lyase/cystathionine gamma-synthase